ncbi:MAG TPA: DUF6443 domain-containing protein, partial [Cyclobacteriaceae bacterium]|nr:DUF6443 domain-containing protein [Cyclobacteriaceae bacterium]
SAGYSEYQWYDQNNTLLGTTTQNYLTVSTTLVSSYKVKGKDSWGCWSGMSPAGTITVMQGQGPVVSQQGSCYSTTMSVNYPLEGSGVYEIEWFTVASGGTRVYYQSLTVPGEVATYTTSGGTYWVDVYDVGNSCRSPRTQVVVSDPTPRYVSGQGQSCEYGTAQIQAQGTNVSSFELFQLIGGVYNSIDVNTTGTFTITNFTSNDPNYVSTYYLKGAGGGCATQGYTQVGINVIRPAMPTVTGNFNPCYNTSTTLTASGGSEGNYRWYLNSSPTPIAGQNGSQLSTGNLTVSTTYYVSYMVPGPLGQCESPRKQVIISPTALPSITGFTVSPGNMFYGTVSPMLTLSNTGSVGTVIYESSVDGTNWSPTPLSFTVNQPSTQIRATATNGNCMPTQAALVVSLFPAPVISVQEGVNYLTYGSTLHLSTQITYAVTQWLKDGINIVGANGTTLAVTEPGIYTAKVKGSLSAPDATTNVTILRNSVEAQNLNYISTITLLKGGQDPSQLEDIDPVNFTQSTTYYDGLGRPMQNVATQGSPTGLDIIQPIVYDMFGRESKKYLPFTSGNTGWYKPHSEIIDAAGNYIGIAQSFYSTPSDNVADDAKPYAEVVFELSPLNRVLKQGAPGTTWQPNSDPNSINDNTVKKRYQTNTTDEVLLVTYNSQTGLVNCKDGSGFIYYDPVSLYKSLTYDEHNHEVIEFIDKEGRTILKRVEAGINQSTELKEYADTYYVFDDLGNLAVVLPPEAVKEILTQP